MTTAAELEAAIEAAIAAGADDAHAFLIYADWLQSRDDPRGELIVFHHEGKTDEAEALLASRPDDFLGAFAGFTTDPQTGRVLELGWQHGFIHHAHLGWPNNVRRAEAAAQLRAFLDLPSCRFLKHLKLGPAPGGRVMDFGFLLAVLAEAGKPRTLRTLFAGDRGSSSMSQVSTGPVAGVLAAFPRLRHLTLHGGRVAIGAIDHAELRAFGVQTSGLDHAALRDLCAAVWPRLERLEIWFGRGHCRLGDVAPILAGTSLPSLRHLGLMNCGFADELAAALPASPLLRRLESLDLSMGALSDRGMRVMAGARLAFAHLESLSVADNALTPASRPLVRGLARRVTFGDRQDPKRAASEDPYGRSVSMGE